MPGGGGNGVCRITCSPTQRIRGPFQRATSRPPLPDLLGDLLLTEEPLGKIYSLRQFRHLPAQLLDAFDQFRMVFAGSPGGGTVPQSLGEGLPDRRERDHPGEKTTNRHDRDKQRQNPFHYPFRGLARSRSAKSIRSASSATSSRTAWSSLRISSRSAGSMPGFRCSPAIRLATAAATGRSTQNVPPKNMKAATASGPFMSATFSRAAARRNRHARRDRRSRGAPGSQPRGLHEAPAAPPSRRHRRSWSG